MDVEGITVKAYRYEPDPPAGYFFSGSDVSGVDGTWNIESLVAGEWYIFSFSDSANRYKRGFWAGGSDLFLTQKSLSRLEFENDPEEIGLIERRLMPSPLADPPAAIDVILTPNTFQRIYVLDDMEAPIVGATVTAMRVDVGEYYNSAQANTDSEGKVEFLGLQESKYYIFRVRPNDNDYRAELFFKLSGDGKNTTTEIIVASQIKGKAESDPQYYDIVMKLTHSADQSGTTNAGDGIIVNAIERDGGIAESTTTTGISGSWEMKRLDSATEYTYQFRDLSGVYHLGYYKSDPPGNFTRQIENASYRMPSATILDVDLEAI